MTTDVLARLVRHPAPGEPGAGSMTGKRAMPDPTDTPRVKQPTKEERERDAAQAVRDYEAERQAIDARTARLRALRLAKEAAEAPHKKARRQAAGDR